MSVIEIVAVVIGGGVFLGCLWWLGLAVSSARASQGSRGLGQGLYQTLPLHPQRITASSACVYGLPQPQHWSDVQPELVLGAQVASLTRQYLDPSGSMSGLEYVMAVDDLGSGKPPAPDTRWPVVKKWGGMSPSDPRPAPTTAPPAPSDNSARPQPRPRARA